MEISEKAKSIAPSVTLEVSAKANALKAEGASIIAFTAGEPDFNTPKYIVDAAKRAMDEGKTKYTATPGIVELKRAIAEKFERENGLTYSENQIVVSDGAKSSLYHAFAAILNEGDEVIVPSPYWVTYVEQIKMSGGVAVVVKTDEKSGYKLIKSQLERAITPKTKCLLLNSPCNPTGVVYGEEELKEIAYTCEKHGLYIVSDEVYEKLVFDGKKHVSIASVSDYAKQNTIVVNGVSKTYAMTGWRIGYLAAPLNVAKAISAMQGHTTSNACTVSQYAALAAISDEEGKQFIEFMTSEFDERRKILASLLEKEGIEFVYPDGAFYVFMKVDGYFGKSYDGNTIRGSVDFCNLLLSEGVAAVPGAAFGADGFVRLAYTVSKEDEREGVKRISAFLKKLV